MPPRPYKIRLLQRAHPLRTNAPIPTVHFAAKRGKVALPLSNHRGLLNGVFETPRGKVIEIRFDGISYSAYSKRNKLGEVSQTGDFRKVAPPARGKGIASALFDLMEPALAYARAHEGETTIQAYALKKGSAAFYLSRGYRPIDPADKPLLRDLKTRYHDSERFDHPIYFSKPVKGAFFNQPLKWHRIKVIGKSGRAVWYTVRVAEGKHKLFTVPKN